MRRSLTIAGLGLAVAGVAAGVLIGGQGLSRPTDGGSVGGQQAGGPAPKPIAWTKVSRFEAAETRNLPGVLRPVQEAPLSFEVAGRIETLSVEIGDSFEAGEVLATLDRRSYELALEERKGQLAEARAQLSEAQEDFERQKQLYEEGWVSKSAFDRAKSQLETARSRVDTAQARVDIAQEDLQDTRLTAPYAGTVGERHAEPSQRVNAGQTVLEIQGRDGRLEAVVSAPETIVDRLDPGSTHTVHLPAQPDLALTGEIADIATEAATRNAYTVTLHLTDAPETLRSGMTAEVDFSLRSLRGDTAEGPLMAIPATAFLAGSGNTKVAFVVDPDANVLHRREIQVVDITDGTALVSAGLDPGEIVATKGLAFLSDGQRVSRLGVGTKRFSQ
jgi:RND family efflux transporter MFP subunit